MPDLPAIPPPAATLGPQLFFGAEEVSRLRRSYAENPLFAGLRDHLDRFDRVAERRYLRETLQTNDHLVGLGHVARTAEEMAMTHLLTGDEDAAALAIECIRAIMRFPTWDFFVDDAGCTIGSQRAPSSIIAVTCVLDWLGARVTASERQHWLEAVATRGCASCHLGLEMIRDPRSGSGWFFDPTSSITKTRSDTHTDGTRRAEITQTTNLRAVPAGGLALGAVLLARYGHPHAELATWLNSAIEGIRAFGHIYRRDGSYDEGVHYADYTGRSLMVGMTALHRAGVIDLRPIINWPGHVRFLLNLSLPTWENPHEVINISDNGWPRLPMVPPHPPESRSALPFWIAREFRDPTAHWYGTHLAAGHNLWSLVFYDETMAAEAPAGGPRLWCPEIEWIVARAGYEPNDLVVSLRSGRGANHEHADRNSLIIKYHGEPLIVDPLRPPYSYADPAWMMRGTEGHSAVLVGGLGHHYHNGVEGTNATHARAHLVRQAEVPGRAWWLSDASHAYRLRDAFIRSVARGIVVFFDLPVVVVIDRVTRWRDTATVEARFFGDNWGDRCILGLIPDGFEIARPRAKAVAKVFGRHPLHLRTDLLPIPAERARLHPFVAITTPAVMATTLITVFSFPGTNAGGPAPVFAATPDVISIQIAGAPTMHIADSGDLPQITFDA